MIAARQKPSSDYSVYREEDFDFLSRSYAELYSQSAATAFQAPLWMHHLHTRLAPRLAAQPLTLTIRDRDGLVAVLPLVQQRANGVSIVQPADFGVCDYNAPVATLEMLTRVSHDDALRGQLRQALGPWDVLMHRKIRPETFDMARLFGHVRASEAENPAYHCETGADFYAWRKSLRPKFSKELERLQRQSERDLGSYEHRALTDAQEIRAAFDFIRESRRHGRYEESLLDDDSYFEFYREYAVAAAGIGEAATYVSTIEGKLVAALFGLAGDGGFHAVLIGADTQNHPNRSVGIQLIYRIIELRMLDGHDNFDMGLGDPGYKSHFRPIRTTLSNQTVSRTPTGAAVALVYHHAKPAKNALRRMAANVR